MQQSNGMIAANASRESFCGGRLSDGEVVQRVRAGEVALFEILRRRYNRRLYRVARAILGDADEAEDVMQEAYVRAYAHLTQFAGRASVATWMTKIAVHEALARARRRGRFAASDVVSDLERDSMFALRSPVDVEQQVARREWRRALETAIAALPAPYRAVSVLREVEELSTAETAEIFNLWEQTVKTRLHRARLLLRRSLYARMKVAVTDVFEFHLSRCDRVVQAVFTRITTGGVSCSGTD
jgi:RNA polymerase sigma-70 factor, ECF subfamily